MLKNYLAIAFRTIRKHKLYSFINVFGLAIGLASFFLIGLFVKHEKSFDQFHENKDRIFKIVQIQPQNMYLGSNRFAVTSVDLVEALTDEMPSVELSVQINDTNTLLSARGEGFIEHGLWSTESFFDIFSFDLISGDRETVLTRPEDIVLTESLARRLFGSSDPMGQLVEYTGWQGLLTFSVAGIMKDVPSNSHLQFGYIIPFLANENRERQAGWGSNSYHTYALVREGTNQVRFDQDLVKMVDPHLTDQEWIQEHPELKAEFYTIPLVDLHFSSNLNFDLGESGDIRYIWLFSLVAFLILITACVNYMNLATARAALRGREVGIRKVSGANLSQLVRQFLGEAISVSMLAAIFSLVLVVILLPSLNQLVERSISISAFLSPINIAIVIGTALFVGITSGLYPAFFLSRMQPVTVLKGSGGMSKRSLLRNFLVISQFSIGIILVLGSIVIQKQISFITTTETGVERDQILTVRVRDQGVSTNSESLVRAMAEVSGVLDISSGNSVPIRVSSNSNTREWEGAGPDDSAQLWNAQVNFGYTEIVGLEILFGTSFSRDRPLEAETGILLNESAIKALGWSNETAVGKTLSFQGKTTVIGVMKDFHFQSLHEVIAPLAFTFSAERNGVILAKISSENIPATVASIGVVWKNAVSKYPFDYEFMDDTFNKQYQTELRLSSILSIFTTLALIVAALGLFGLASFTAQQRTKEIGIRKVLGASSPSIIKLMSRDFGSLVGMAFLVGAPIAYFVMNKWLQAFPYRTTIDAWTFIWVGLIAFLLAFIAVGYQALKSSLANPIESLRYE